MDEYVYHVAHPKIRAKVIERGRNLTRVEFDEPVYFHDQHSKDQRMFICSSDLLHSTSEEAARLHLSKEDYEMLRNVIES